MIAGRVGRYLAAHFAGDLAVCSALAGLLLLALAPAIASRIDGLPLWSLATPLCLLAAEWMRWRLTAHAEWLAIAEGGAHPLTVRVLTAAVALGFALAVCLLGDGVRPSRTPENLAPRAYVTTDDSLAVLGAGAGFLWREGDAWPVPTAGREAGIAVGEGADRRRSFVLRTPFTATGFDGDPTWLRWIWFALGPLGTVSLLLPGSRVTRSVPWLALALCLLAV